MFYLKLYAALEYSMEIMLAWALYQVTPRIATAWVIFRVVKFFVTFRAEQEVLQQRIKNAIAATKQFTDKVAAATMQPVTTTGDADNVTLQ